MKKSKSGITLVSLVVYLVLFTTFTIFSMNISSNMSDKIFENRGEAINKVELTKLQGNLEDSTKKSTDVAVVGTNITFSNGDLYTYDSENNVILKNGGVLATSVSKFIASSETVNNCKKINIQVGFNKYGKVTERNIVCVVEVNV